jgi:opine dehydrogenase
MNGNMVLHCATAVLNAGWIEWTKGDFEFYWHGMTKSVCRVLEKIDEEKNMVGSMLGFNLKPILFNLNKFYPTEKAKTLYEFVKHSRAHGGAGTKSLKGRYISEDVPVGLVATSSFGKLCNIPTTTIDSIIWLASILNEEDYRTNGRNLDALGFKGMKIQEIINYVNI